MTHHRYHTGIEEFDDLRFNPARPNRPLRIAKLYPFQNGWFAITEKGELYASSVETKWYASLHQVKTYVLDAASALGKISKPTHERLTEAVLQLRSQDQKSAANTYLRQHMGTLGIKLTKGQENAIKKIMAEGTKVTRTKQARPRGAG